LHFKRRVTSQNTAPTDTEAEEIVMDNPSNVIVAGSSEPNPSRESPQERIKRKAESKAFLGVKKTSFADIAAGKKQQRQRRF